MCGRTGTHSVLSRPQKWGIMSPVELVADPTQPFAGKVALVNGAARPRGIGRATALRLAQGGADVACLDLARPITDAPADRQGGVQEKVVSDSVDVGGRR